MFSATLKKKKDAKAEPWFVFQQPCAGVWPAGFQLRVSDWESENKHPWEQKGT